MKLDEDYAEKRHAKALDLFATWVKQSGVSARKLSVAAGWSPGYLGQVQTGRIELKVEHVIRVMSILGREREYWQELAKSASEPSPHGSLQSLKSELTEEVFQAVLERLKSRNTPPE